MSEFQFTISDLASDDTSAASSNPFYRENMKGLSGPLTSSNANAFNKGGSVDWSSYQSNSVLDMSNVLMNVPIIGNANASAKNTSDLLSALSGSGKLSSQTLGIFGSIIPGDTSIGAGQNSQLTGATAQANDQANQGNPTPTSSKLIATTGPVDVVDFVGLAMQQTNKAYDEISSAIGPDIFDCCLVPESQIQTPTGPRMIKNILPGQQVYSWLDGKLVTRTVIASRMQGEQEVFELRTRNRAIKASANHPFLVATKKARKYEWEFQWKRLDKLSRGDLIVTYENDDEIDNIPMLPNETLLDDKLAWLLGLMVADGHVTSTGFNICVYDELRNQTIRLVKELWGITGHPHPAHGIIFCSLRYKMFFELLGMKIPGLLKRVPDVIWGSNNQIKHAFLDGFWEGDGSNGKEQNSKAYHSASYQLITEVRLMHIMLNDKVSNISTNMRKNPIIIKGKLVKNAQPLYTFAMWSNSSRRMVDVLRNKRLRDFMPDMHFAVQRVAKITSIGLRETWDIEIEDSHNYIADGILVHNSGLVYFCLHHFGATFAAWPRTTIPQYNFCKAAGLDMSVTDASNTYGALLFVGNNQGPAGQHVAISMGDGKHVMEASTSHAPLIQVSQYAYNQIGVHTVGMNAFDVAATIPSINYAKVVYGKGIGQGGS